MNVDGALSCARTSLGRADASFQSGRTAKPQCIVSNFFEVKDDMLKPLLAQEIVFFATKLVDNSKKIPPPRVECRAIPNDAL